MAFSLPNTRLVQPLPIFFLIGLIFVNVIAILPSNPLYVGSFISFAYIIIVPGLLLLPFLTEKKIPVVLGFVMSISLSILLLMVIGLAINTLLPLFGNNAPLTTLPLLLCFDALIYILLSLNFLYHKDFPFEIPSLNAKSWRVLYMSILLPPLACLGAIQLNNGGSNILAMAAYGLIAAFVVAMIIGQESIEPLVPPIALFSMAASLLLANSMRGWFVTGHDVLLEYHVFTLVNNAHFWSMSLYQDAYMACLSITILPTYLQNLIHVSDAYMYKVFFQFLSAGTVVYIYYLAKEYVSKTIAFLAAVLYISFPTFMTDMAFLNRQGVALLFFGGMLFVMLCTEYASGWKRNALLLLFGIGMVLSHYSTSYVAIAILAGAYIINRIFRWIGTAERPRFLMKMKNRDVHKQPILLTFWFVLLLLGVIFLWSAVITKTADNVLQTIEQIGANVTNAFSNDEHSGLDQYSLVKFNQVTPEQLFQQFVKQEVQYTQSSTIAKDLFPASQSSGYNITLSPEPVIPLTSLGLFLQNVLHLNFVGFYQAVKQWYAYVIQFLLIVGLIGMMIGYGFRNNSLKYVPTEYLALSTSGLLILVGQTVLPSSAVDYGVLRLFQQNLILLGLPIVMGVILFFSLVWREHKRLFLACSMIFLIFFLILSGFLPELTGGGRPALPLNNYGLYYDIYYTHAQEVSSIDWLYENGDPNLTIQSDPYSATIKVLGYVNLGTAPGLLPQTIERSSYVYLGYNNVENSTIIQYFYGDVGYYRFPMNFLGAHKNLIYNNGGSEIYQ